MKIVLQLFIYVSIYFSAPCIHIKWLAFKKSYNRVIKYDKNSTKQQSWGRNSFDFGVEHNGAQV